MAFNINRFHSEIARTGGVAMTSNFTASIYGPQFLQADSDARTLSFRISDIDFPQRTITPADYLTYGPPMIVGTRANYIPIDLSVLLSPDFRERDYFLAWQDLISGNARNPNLNQDQSKKRFDIGYYDDYAKGSFCVIEQYTETGEPVHTVTLLECYPLTVGPLTATWSQTTPSMQRINLAFRYFTDKTVFSVNQPAEMRSSMMSILNQTGIGGAMSTAGGLIANKIGVKKAAAIFGATSVLSRLGF